MLDCARHILSIIFYHMELQIKRLIWAVSIFLKSYNEMMLNFMEVHIFTAYTIRCSHTRSNFEIMFIQTERKREKKANNRQYEYCNCPSKKKGCCSPRFDALVRWCIENLINSIKQLNFVQSNDFICLFVHVFVQYYGCVLHTQCAIWMENRPIH